MFQLLGAGLSAAGSIAGGLFGKSAADDLAHSQWATANYLIPQAKAYRDVSKKGISKAADKQVKGLYDAREATRSHYNQAMEAQLGELEKGLEAVGERHDEGVGYLTDAQSQYAKYMEQGGRGLQAYSDILGLNGQAAADAAMRAYNTSPGFKEAMDHAANQVQQGAATRGQLTGPGGGAAGLSGPAAAALFQVGQRMKLDDFYKYRDSLAGLGEVGLRATDSYGQISQSLANLAYNTGSSEANLRTQMGTVRGDTGRAIGDAVSGYHLARGSTRANEQLMRTGQNANFIATKANIVSNAMQNSALANAYGKGQMGQAIGGGLSALGGAFSGGGGLNFLG